MTADYHSAQGDFSSIVYKLAPMAMTNFVMWLDLKVAEFKIYGQMLLDEQDTNVTQWFLRSGMIPDILPHAKQKPQFSSNARRCDRSKRPISSTAPQSRLVYSSASKQQKLDISCDNEGVEIESSSILPIETTSMMDELNDLQSQMSSYLNSSQTSKSSSQVSKSHPKPQKFTTFPQKDGISVKKDVASFEPLIDDMSLSVSESRDKLDDSQTNMLSTNNSRTSPSNPSHTLLSPIPHASQTDALTSSNKSRISFLKSDQFSGSPISLQASSQSAETSAAAQSTNTTTGVSAPETWSSSDSNNMDMVLKVEPADEEFDQIEKQKSQFSEVSHMDKRIMNVSEGDLFSSGHHVQIVSKDNAMYLDDGSGEQFTDDKASERIQNQSKREQKNSSTASSSDTGDDPGYRVLTDGLQKFFHCLHCTYKTVYHHNMIRHRRMHSGNLFCCKICGNRYYDTYALTMHMKAHSGELVCRFCGKRFASAQGLHRHEKLHAENNAFRLSNFV